MRIVSYAFAGIVIDAACQICSWPEYEDRDEETFRQICHALDEFNDRHKGKYPESWPALVAELRPPLRQWIFSQLYVRYDPLEPTVTYAYPRGMFGTLSVWSPKGQKLDKRNFP